jgi:hypothetical protein
VSSARRYRRAPAPQEESVLRRIDLGQAFLASGLLLGVGAAFATFALYQMRVTTERLDAVVETFATIAGELSRTASDDRLRGAVREIQDLQGQHQAAIERLVRMQGPLERDFAWTAFDSEVRPVRARLSEALAALDRAEGERFHEAPHRRSKVDPPRGADSALRRRRRVGRSRGGVAHPGSSLRSRGCPARRPPARGSGSRPSSGSSTRTGAGRGSPAPRRRDHVPVPHPRRRPCEGTRRASRIDVEAGAD